MPVQPVNYQIDVPDPIETVMRSMQIGSAIGDIRQKRETNELAIQKQQQEQQRKREMYARLSEMANQDEILPQDIDRLMIEYPEMADKFKESHKLQTEAQRQVHISELSQVYAALKTDKPEVALQILDEKKQALINAGKPTEAEKIDLIAKQIQTNPKSAQLSTGMALASTLPADKFASMFDTLTDTEKTYTPLTESEKKKLNLDPEKEFQIASDGKISQIGTSGDKITIKMGPDNMLPNPPDGWGYVVDKSTELGFRQVPIPGGKVETELKNVLIKKGETQELTTRAADVVIKDIGRLEKKITDAPWYQPVAGILAAKILPGLNQGRMDANALAKTIRANVGFDRLQQMRDASPNGGALGAVSERELETLESVIGSLELAQSEQQLLENLDRLKTIYSGILKKAAQYPNAADFGFSLPETQRATVDQSVMDVLNRYRN